MRYVQKVEEVSNYDDRNSSLRVSLFLQLHGYVCLEAAQGASGSASTTPSTTEITNPLNTLHTARHVCKPEPRRKWMGLWLGELTPLVGVTS